MKTKKTFDWRKILNLNLNSKVEDQIETTGENVKRSHFNGKKSIDEIKAKVVSYFKLNKDISTGIGTIVVEDKIGEGGNGIVFSAKWKNKNVAIKIFCHDIQFNQAKYDRYIDEITIQLFSYESPYLVRILHFGMLEIEKGYLTPYYVMPKYERTLKKFHTEIKSDEQKSAEAKRIFKELCFALRDIHERRIIHRDLKPENILISNDNKLVLCDLGLSFFDNDLERQAETKRGERLANYLYSAPEQFNNASPTNTMDIFSLAQIMQWFIYAEPHRGTERKKLSEFDSSLNILDSTIDRMLVHDYKKRIQTIEEVIDLVESGNTKIDPTISLSFEMWNFSAAFDHALRKSFPGKNGTFLVEDQKTIDELLTNIAEDQKKMNLWYTWGDGNNLVEKLIRKENERWIISTFECLFKGIYIHKGSSVDRSYLLFWLKKDSSFWSSENVLHSYDGKIMAAKHLNSYITPEEHEDGYAIINGKTIRLEERSELRERFVEDSFLFIAPNSNTVLYSKNDSEVSRIITELKNKDDKISVLEERMRRLQKNHILSYTS